MSTKKASLLAAIMALAVALVAYLGDILPGTPPTPLPADSVLVPPDTTVPVDTAPPVVEPAPTPTPTPAPVVTPPSKPGTYTALRADDFTTYRTTAALHARIAAHVGGTATPDKAPLYTDGVGAALVSLDTVVRYNGHPTMRYDQPGGQASTPTLAVGLGSAGLTKVWLRAKVRFSPGYTTTGTLTNSANAYKLLGWGWQGPEGSGRLEITNTDQYDFYWNVQNGGTVTGGGNHAAAGRITTEWSDGGWYDYILHLDHSGKTGVARLWMAKDGQPPVLKATVTGVMLNGSALPLLNRVMLGLNFNQVRTAKQSQAVWYGQWEVIDGAQSPNPFALPGL